MKFLRIGALLLSVSLALSACSTTTAGTHLTTSPAPLAHTQVDDHALIAVDHTFDLALDAINLLIDNKVITPGTPKAKSLAAVIRKVNTALDAGASFAAAGSNSSYLAALHEAETGIAQLRSILKGS